MEFVDPPLSSRERKSEEWKSRVEQMKANPLKWALIGEFSPGVSTQIKNGDYKAFLPEELRDAEQERKQAYMRSSWQIRTTRSNKEKRMSLYIKWIG